MNANTRSQLHTHRYTNSLDRLLLSVALTVGATLALSGQAHAGEPLVSVPTNSCNTNVAINNAVGQSFRVSSTAPLERIDIWMKPNLYYTTSYEVRLYDGEGPSGTLLATSNTLTLGSSTGGEPTGWRGFSFALSVDLQANHTYTLQLTRLSQYSGAFSLCGNVYSGGKLYWLGSYPQAHEDMSFRVIGPKNLLANGHANTGDMSGWTITQNGGAGWKASGGQFHTSYNLASREQLVDLYAHGYDAATMASAPPIFVSERFRPTYCPDTYFLEVELLDENMTSVASFATGTVQQTGPCTWTANWETVQHTFTGYGPGVRYVRWRDGGDDSEYWAGHYGPAMDDAILTVGTNLLANPSADSNSMAGWTLTQNGGEGWAAIGNIFRTSYSWNRRSQVVDLTALGYDPEFLDSAPEIFISEQSRKWYCPDFYEVKVELLDSNMNVIDVFETGVLQHAGSCNWGGDFETVSFTFADYGPGVRYVRWQDGGKDSEYWAGRYGAVLDNAVLALR